MTPSTEPALWNRLHAEHDRLNGILEDVRYLAEHRSFQTAARRFGEYLRAQERHMATEEWLLEMLEQAGRHTVAIDSIQSAHGVIRGLLHRIGEALSRANLAVFGEATELLQSNMKAHEQQEAKVLFPGLDSVFGDSEPYRSALRELVKP